MELLRSTSVSFPCKQRPTHFNIEQMKLTFAVASVPPNTSCVVGNVETTIQLLGLIEEFLLPRSHASNWRGTEVVDPAVADQIGWAPIRSL
jgi:hypothetical protein